jgi:hypothetical protein
MTNVKIQMTNKALISNAKTQIFKGASKNVIPVKTGIQKPLTSLDSRLRGSDKLIIIRGSLKI